MARDKVLPPRNCFCAYVKMDINNLNDTFFEMVRDKDCGPQLYTANYDKSMNDNMKKIAMKYAVDKDDIRISPCEDDVDSKNFIKFPKQIIKFLRFNCKYSVHKFHRNIQCKYSLQIYGRYIPYKYS